MRLRHFDLNLLLALDALLDTHSVTRAAERMNLSQSAVSSALGRLREHFGDQLLVHVGRRMELTPLALGLTRPVREALDRVQAAVMPQAQFDLAVTNRCFIINAKDNLTTVLLTQLMMRLQSEAPGISLQIVDASESVSDILDRNELDFVLCADVHGSSAHPRELLFKDVGVCVVSADNSRVDAELTLEDYLRLGHVAVRFGSSRAALHEPWLLPDLASKRRIEVIVSSFNALPQFVLGTSRIATMHASLARWYAGFLPLRVLPPPWDMGAVNFVAQWHPSRGSDPGHAWMRNLLLEVASTTVLQNKALFACLQENNEECDGMSFGAVRRVCVPDDSVAGAR